MMTTITTLAALVPVLLATGRGSDVMTPMALPVFGGMLAATVIGVILIPVLYVLFQNLREWLKGGMRQRDQPAGE